jgi:hypothetical protein
LRAAVLNVWSVDVILVKENIVELPPINHLSALRTLVEETTVAGLVATLKEQAAQIQKVSAQLEVNKTAPQTVLNNQ